MIEIYDNQIGEEKYEIFSILNEGFRPTGYVQMDCRMSDMKSEGVALFMYVYDEDVIKSGDYSPLEMNIEELRQFIDYLEDCHKKMSLTPKVESDE